MNELCCEHLSVWCIDCVFYYVTCAFRVNLHSAVAGFTTQLNHLASLGNRLSVCLQTKWLWVPVPLQPLLCKPKDQVAAENKNT